MKLHEKIQDKIDRNLGLKRMISVITILLTLLLVMLTWPFWSFLISRARIILTPFVFGFGLAYLLRPIVLFFERKRIKRSISVPLVLVGVIILISVLLASIFPSIYEDIESLLAMAGEGINGLYQFYLDRFSNSSSEFVGTIVQSINASLNTLLNNIPSLPNFMTNIFNTTLHWLTTTLFTIIIGLYFTMDYEKVTQSTLRIADKVSYKLKNSILVINKALSLYLRTLIVIMMITFVEYSLFYFLVGHKYALVMGILSAIALLIPYVGGILVNTIGFITGLSLGAFRVLLIALGILILPNVDAYLIAPMVYSKRNEINPLWSLFSFFACATLFGFVGILISTPLYFSVRAVLDLRRNNWVIETEK